MTNKEKFIEVFKVIPDTTFFNLECANSMGSIECKNCSHYNLYRCNCSDWWNEEYKSLKNKELIISSNNNINHPSHYAEGRKYEPIEVIEDWGLNFSLGNAVKYISRAGRKNKNTEIEDLEKSAWYINREIDRLKRSKDDN